MEAVRDLAQAILIKSADLTQPLTIPLQVRSAIQIAETFHKEWDLWNATHQRGQTTGKDRNVLDTVFIAFTQGGKIPAIKEYRALTGAGLKESKDQVEAWAQEYNWVSPTKPQW